MSTSRYQANIGVKAIELAGILAPSKIVAGVYWRYELIVLEAEINHWRIGIIGCGWAGAQHAHALRALAGRAELCVVADSDAERAEACARDWQVPRWTPDYHELLAAAQLDAVSVCLPHHLHAQVAIEALGAGLHVLVEKPLATTLAEADAMIAAAARAERTLMVAENSRFDATYVRAAGLIRSGMLGDLFLVRIAREHQMHEYLRARPWFLGNEAGGIMYSGGIHDFELLRMLAGEIAHVYALAGRKVLPEMRADDTSVALAGMHSGAAAVIVESFSLQTPAPGVHGTLHGSRGSMWFAGDQIRLYTAPHDGQPELVETITVPQHDTFEAELTHFLDCLDDGTEPRTSARAERKPLVAVLAAYESIRRGARVELADM